jgi:hypothetical protein
MSFIIAGAIAEFRKTASRTTNAKMAAARCAYVLRIKRERSAGGASAATTKGLV